MEAKKRSIYVDFYTRIPQELRSRVIILVPLLSLSGMLEVASLAALIPLVGLLLDPESVYGVHLLGGLEGFSEFEKVGVFFLLFLSLIILKGIFVFLVTKFTFNTALLIKSSIQKKLFGLYLNKNYIQHLDSNTANYIRNITTECHQMEGRFVMPALTFLAELLPVIFICLFLVYINPLGVLFAAVVFILSGYLITRFTSKSLKQYGADQLGSDGMQIKVAKESFSALKEIYLYKRQNKLSCLYAEYVDKSVFLIGKALALGQLPKLVLEVMGLISIAIIAGISIYNGSSVNQVLVETAVFIGAIVKLLPSSNRIVMNIQSLNHARPAIENILQELDGVSVKTENEPINKLGELKSISLKGVGFKYKSRDHYVFEDLNLEIKRGIIIGLIGETGVGKSTFVDMLLGFITPSKGEVLVNGIDLQKVLPAWQAKIGYVPQDVVLFDDTLKNNILFFDSSFDEKRLSVILRELKLESLIESLPYGLNTSIGEAGGVLSGGQKQRVGIARALVRNPEFIIFDEATSALDSTTEKSINALIKKLKINCTVLVIAHKKSALEICDEIYQIKDRRLLKQIGSATIN